MNDDPRYGHHPGCSLLETRPHERKIQDCTCGRRTDIALISAYTRLFLLCEENVTNRSKPLRAMVDLVQEIRELRT